ncbi:MAG: KpsF/GutQ family sugar-phosphate isomerase [Planctomycetota bacterium]
MRELEIARKILFAEADSVRQVADHLTGDFAEACRRILACTGRVVVTGMGKAGLIGEKISATLSSTGTPSYSLHPAEAVHGDLGRIVKGDLILTLSNSGETEEILRVLPSVKKVGNEIVSITGNPESSLARHSDLVLSIGNVTEACPMGLAPTASTTAMLALGDALAMTVLELREFSVEEYAFFHPGGNLGRKLLKVREVMRTGEANPCVRADVRFRDAVDTMTNTPGKPGAVNIVDDDGHLVGVFTDGDLRRLIQREPPEIFQLCMSEIMSRHPKTIGPERLATEALGIMKEKKIDQLPVVDHQGVPVGLLDVQDLIAVGLV